MATAQKDIPVECPRALVVDDSQIARYVLSGQLKRLGFEVEAAGSAEAAVKRLTGPLPDVVFMDHLLPGMNGLEAVRRLRSRPRSARLPIVMYTAQDGEQFADRARDCGADAIFVKTEEESNLGVILRRLELLPKQDARGTARSNVLPLRGKLRPRDEERSADTDTPLHALSELLEPILESQHEKLRRELLAEFVILEHYEERMRRDLFRRVEGLTRHATDRLEDSFMQWRGQQRTVRPWRLAAMAAGVLLAIGAGLTAALGLHQRIGDIAEQNMSAMSALKSQTVVLEDLRATVTAQRHGTPSDVGAPAAPPDPTSSAAGEPYEAPSAAQALVAELQGMGILGSIRIETSAGSFCVGSTPTSYRMEAGGGIDDCEVLPLAMTAARW